MALQPGPFRLATAADIAAAPGVYDFEADADKLASDLHGIGGGWDPMLVDLENFAAEGGDVAPDIDFDGIIADLAVVDASLPLSYMGDIDGGWTSGQAMLDTATAFAPQQAWIDPGAPFVPPDSSLTIKVPEINPAAFVPAPNFTVGAGSAGKNPSVGLFNLTRYGSLNFSVGDQFEVIALGPPGDDVSVMASLNGDQLPPLDEGTIDSTGQMFITGTMGPEHVGVWNQQWSIGGALMADFNFVVSPE